jgi:hypothetical protein
MAKIVDKREPKYSLKLDNKTSVGVYTFVSKFSKSKLTALKVIGEPDWDLKDWNNVDFDTSPKTKINKT